MKCFLLFLKAYWKILTLVFVVIYLTVNTIEVLQYSSPSRLEIPRDYVQFNSEIGGFSISISRNWLIRETPHGDHGDEEIVAGFFYFTLFSPDYVIGEVGRKEFGASDSSQVINWGILRKIDAEGYHLIQQGSLNTSQYKGYQHEYERLDGPSSHRRIYHCIDWYTTQGSVGYAFVFCARKDKWEYTKDTFDWMINSISLEE